MVKKGEFPAKPPTMAEAMGEGKTENKSDNKVASAQTPPRPSVKQVDAHLNEPLSADAPATIESGWITPDKSEAIVNLQMDYILQRKSLLTRAILGSRFFSSVVIGIMGVIAYYRLNEYVSDYLLKDGYFAAAKALLSNSYFLDDLVNVVFTYIFLFTACFITIKYQIAWLQRESEEVKDNMETYFNADLSIYSTVKNVQKPKKDEKDMVHFFKANSVVVDYREAPIAFMVIKPVEGEDNSYEITAYGVRRVYVKAEVFADVLGLTLKKLVNKGDFKIKVKLYSFETLDAKVLRKAGFVKSRSESFSFFLSNFLNLTLDTYEFELNAVEF